MRQVGREGTEEIGMRSQGFSGFILICICPGCVSLFDMFVKTELKKKVLKLKTS